MSAGTPDAPTVSRGMLLLLLLALVIAWFSTLDQRRLIKPDEGRYAEIAREMAQSGDFVTPRLNAIKYFEKPPLQYWATAIAFNAFGENEWTARLWSAITGFAGILVAAFTARRLFGARAALYGGLVLASSLWWALMSHINTLDMGFAFFLCFSMCGFLLGQHAKPGGREERAAMLAAWAGAALAVLSKGIAGLVLPGMVLVAYCLIQRDVRPLLRLHAGKGLALFFAIASPWFIVVQMTHPEFAQFFFIHEHFQRFVDTEHRRTQALWYFVPILALAVLPWTGMAVHSALRAWRERSGVAQAGFNPSRFLLLWVVLIFAFFSASSSKLPSYILPIVPALAMLTGHWLTGANPRAVAWHLAAIGIIAAIFTALVPTLALRSGGEAPDEMLVEYSRWIVAALGIAAAGLITSAWLARQQRMTGALVLTACACLAAWLAALTGHETLGRSNSAYYIAEEIKPHLRPGTPFYSVGTYDQTLPFYLERTVTLVDYRDEFSFGIDSEPHLSIANLEKFRERWQGDTEAYALLTPDGYKLLGLYEFPMRVVARDARRVVVAKP